MNLHDLTGQLRQTYAAGKRYRFIEAAHRVLASVPHAPELANLTLRALVESGLGGPARELIQLRGDLYSSEAQRAELQAAIAALPNGRVPWRDCRTIFEKNVEALTLARPQFTDQRPTWEAALKQVQLYRCLDGTCHIARRNSGALREWLGNLSSTEDDADITLPGRGKTGPVAIIGLRGGGILQRVYADTSRLFLTFSHPLYLIEPDAIRFAAWLHSADFSEVLLDERVHIFVGPDAVEHLGETLRSHPRLNLPGLFVNLSDDPRASSNAQTCVQDVSRARDEELASLLARLKQRYAKRDAAYWATRLKPPGVVLGVTSRYTTMLQFSMRDTLAALRCQGFATELLMESQDHEILPATEVARRILEVDPVMLVYLDHQRYEYPYLPKNLPYLGWIQDPMPNLLCRTAGESMGPMDFTCGYYVRRCVDEFAYPASQFHSCAIPVSTREFHDAPVSDDLKSQYFADICFVSNASQSPGAVLQAALAEYPASAHPLLHDIYGRVRVLLEADGHLDLQTSAADLVRSAAASVGLPLTPEQAEHIKTYFAYRLFDWGRRQQTLEWVARWAKRSGRVFRLYGRGWEDHPTLGDFANGIIPHGEPLRSAYRSSALTLQLMPSGYRHQRALEAIAAGTLPLARYCPPDFAGLDVAAYLARCRSEKLYNCAANVFEGLERVVFRTEAEFEEVADRFLADDAWRREVLGDLRRVVLRDHTYEALMAQVVPAFHQSLVNAAADVPERCEVGAR